MKAENYAVTDGDKNAALDKLSWAEDVLISYPGERGMAAFRQILEKAAGLPLTPPREPAEKAA